MAVQSVEMPCHDSGDDSNKSTNEGHLHATIQHKLVLVRELAVFFVISTLNFYLLNFAMFDADILFDRFHDDVSERG